MSTKMKINRACANPNRWTFTIKPIKEILKKYVRTGQGWVDPFSGRHSMAEFTNDLNPKIPAGYHLQAEDFCKMLEGKFNGVLFDPPYSPTQIKRSYEGMGLKPKQEETQSNFYSKVKNAICDKIKMDGYSISFGWESGGFGKARGFEIIEILLIYHGSHHNDTIVTVEQKKWEQKKINFPDQAAGDPAGPARG